MDDVHRDDLTESGDRCWRYRFAQAEGYRTFPQTGGCDWEAGKEDASLVGVRGRADSARYCVAR